MQRFVATVSPKIAPKTTRNFTVTLRSMWRSARAWGHVAHDPFDALVLPKQRPTQRFFFSAEDIQRIVSALKEPLDIFSLQPEFRSAGYRPFLYPNTWARVLPR